MQAKSQKKPYEVTLEYPTGVTRTVKIKAVSREVAERRALKFNPQAKRVRPRV